MHDLGPIAYLDLQKTGSTFVSKFLRECCSLEIVDFRKHASVRNDYREDCFYFVTIRDPVELYSSLYRYGLDKKGGLYKRLKKFDCLSFYKSFNFFVEQLLRIENAEILADGYGAEIASEMGFMSYRFMKMSLQFPRRSIKKALREDKRLATLEEDFITSLEIKNEELSQGLRKLSLEMFPQFFEEKSVLDFLDSNPRVNASSTTADKVERMSKDLLPELKEKEALLLKRYPEF